MAPINRCLAAAASVLLIASPASQALAWGATGHRLVGQVGVAALPDEVPAFVRSPQAVKDIGELAREPDRWRAAGKVHDTTRDPGHFIDVDDDGKILGGPVLNALPPTRTEYEAALRAVSSDSQHAGYLPYAIVDGWQQLAKDFAYWRILKAAFPREKNLDHKAWMQRDLARREAQTWASGPTMSVTAASRCTPASTTMAGAPSPTRTATPRSGCTPFSKARLSANMSAPRLCALT